MTVRVIGSVLLLIAVAGPLPAVAVVRSRRRPPGALLAGLTTAAAVASGALLALVVADGPVSLAYPAGAFGLRGGLVATTTTSVLLVLVCGLSALVQSFARRYLRSDSLAGRFRTRALVVSVAMAVVVASDSLVLAVAAWVVAGAAFSSLFGYRRDLPGVDEGVRPVRWSLAVGDVGLVAAAVIIVAREGDVALGSAAGLAASAGHLGAWRLPVSLLVAAAALSRCAQGPFHGWLTRTVAAPTPVCALLHAGVVNGGGVLLIRLGPLGSTGWSRLAVLLVAGVTAAWSGLSMARHPDVKGRLVASTRAQMGFLLAECAAGLYPAAVVHLVAHGFYKAHLFLGSGSAVRRPGRLSLPAARSARHPVTAALVATAVCAPVLLYTSGTVIGLCAGVTVFTVCLRWSTVRPAGLLGAAIPPGLVLAGTAGYAAISAGAGRILAPAGSVLPGTHLSWLAGFVALTALAWLVSSHPAGRALDGLLREAAAGPRCADRRPPTVRSVAVAAKVPATAGTAVAA